MRPAPAPAPWRRNPDAKWRLKPTDLAELTALQAAILDSAARLTKPGGRLVYVTCSLLREEDEDQVAHFLNTHADFRAPPDRRDLAETIAANAPAAPRRCASPGPARHRTALRRRHGARPAAPVIPPPLAGEGREGEATIEL